MQKIVCHGDSLTQGADIEKKFQWTSILANRLGVDVVNSGIGGDTTAGMLSRFYSDVVHHSPDMVILMGGTNDLWWDLDHRNILANLFTMTCQAEHHAIQPVIGLPIPIYTDNIEKQDFMAPMSGYDRCVEKLKRLVGDVATYAKQNDIVCLDFWSLFHDHRGGLRGDYFLEDCLHPNREAHRQMALLAYDQLKTLIH